MCNKFNYDLTRQKDLRQVMGDVSRWYYGDLGVFLYEAYDHINATFYNGDLPVPLINFALMAYGGCIGLTRSSNDAQPRITLHPSLLMESVKGDNHDRGLHHTYDVILHECVHVAILYLLGRTAGDGDSSHNNSVWVSEVNRISPLIGMTGVDAHLSTVRRVAVDGQFRENGKPLTVVKRGTDGNISREHLSRWPYSVWVDRIPQHYQSSPHALPFAPTVAVASILRDSYRCK